MKLVNFCLVLIAACFCKGQDEQEFEVGIKMVGCFTDVRGDRALPDNYANFRNSIDWNNLNETVKQCADAADKHGYHWFGVQFYGECWSGPSAEVTYNKHGMSTNCWNGVGRDFANAVYKFYMKEKTSRK